MNTKILLIILGIVVLTAGVIYLFRAPSSSSLTRNDAISEVIALHPALAAYKTTSLPPSSIESKEVLGGWYLGFIQRGSGVSGILSALCFHVSDTKNVTAVGQYTRENNAAVQSLDLETCQPEGTKVPVGSFLPFGNVTLKLRDLAQFKDISIRPLSIEEDSRCPIDVQCIQAGTVRVKIEVVSGMGTSTNIVKLEQVFTTEGEAITLTAVAPNKQSKVNLSASDYRLTFTVAKQGAPAANNPHGKCYIGGCSAELCTDSPDAVSTCIYNSKYICYKSASCERQSDGQCGWTDTPQLTACVTNS